MAGGRIEGAGLRGVMRLTWVEDHLAHVLDHCETDEPSGTWTGLACQDHGLALGGDVDNATLRRLSAHGQIADLIWEPRGELVAEHGQLHQAAIQAAQDGKPKTAEQLWQQVQAIWSVAWSANYAALKFLQDAGLSRFSPVTPQRWVVASFEHHRGPHGLPHPHVHNIVITAQVSGVALDASFGASCERVVPAPLREGLPWSRLAAGWRRQQAARRLTGPLIEGRIRLVRRFGEFTGAWPWQWTPGQVEDWITSGGWAHSTVRSDEGALAVFLSYVCDPRYGWIAECEQQVGARPVQVCHEGNTAVHAAEYEGRPQRRPLTRAELQAFLDAADDHVERAAGSRRKGWLAAFRDATLFKVIYGWGLRRREVAMLDVADFAVNPAAPELGGLGICHVRYGKAMRGNPPQRRAVATVMPWAAEALAQYIGQVRPCYEPGGHPALWLTERGGRISSGRSMTGSRPGGQRPGYRASCRCTPAPFVCLAPDRGRRRSAVRAAAGGAFVGVHDGHVYDGGAGCAEPDAAWSTDEASIPPCIVIEARKAPDRLDGQNPLQRESGRVCKLRVLLLERARGRQGADPVVVDALAAHELEP